MEKKEYLQLRNKLNLNLDPRALPLHLFFEVVLLYGIYTCWGMSANSVLRYCAIPLVAILMFRNFAFMHEAVHGSISKNKIINEFLGLYSGALSLLPYDAWKRSHLEHHFWSGNIDRDPVMLIVKVFPNMSAKTKKFLNISWACWFPLLAIMQHAVFWLLSMRQFSDNPRRPFLLVSLALPPIFWVGTFLLLPTFSFTVLAPALLLYLVGVEVVNFPHHMRLPHKRDNTRLAAWEQHEISRSCLYPRWLARLIVMNFNYHTEHHMFPDAPWYRLETIHHSLKEKLGIRLNTDRNISFIVENRKYSLENLMSPGPSDEHKKEMAS